MDRKPRQHGAACLTAIEAARPNGTARKHASGRAPVRSRGIIWAAGKNNCPNLAGYFAHRLGFQRGTNHPFRFSAGKIFLIPPQKTAQVPRVPVDNRLVATMPQFNILVVDDDFSLCEFTGLILAREGYYLDMVHDANQALKQVEQHVYDLIITDLTLPGLPGDQLARFLREQGHQCPILLMTGSLLNAKPDHIDAVLLKPFSISELRKMVAELLKKQTVITRMAA